LFHQESRGRYTALRKIRDMILRQQGEFREKGDQEGSIEDE